MEFLILVTTDPISITGNQIIQRAKLVDKIEQAKQVEYKTAYNNVIEEVAYTWFNRLIAIRFMEINDCCRPDYSSFLRASRKNRT